jgi:hypothetical protein
LEEKAELDVAPGEIRLLIFFIKVEPKVGSDGKGEKDTVVEEVCFLDIELHVHELIPFQV